MGNNACRSCEFVIQKLHIRVNHREKLCRSCEYVLEIEQEIKAWTKMYVVRVNLFSKNS